MGRQGKTINLQISQHNQ